MKTDGGDNEEAEVVDLTLQRAARCEVARLLALALEINPGDPMSVIDEWDRKACEAELAEEAMLEPGRILSSKDEAKAGFVR